MNVMQKAVQNALLEDVGSGDVTAKLLPDKLIVNAVIISREPMLLCGQNFAMETFKQVDANIEVKWLFAEGTFISEPATLCTIQGLARSILTAERTALNFLQLLSATATKTHQYLQVLKGLPTRLLDTRKTLPGLRIAQKYAVACAQGTNHRLGLYDAFLIKENHIKACGSISKAILQAKQTQSELPILVEVENLLELKEALSAKPCRILLDNFSLAMMREAVSMNTPKQCALEVSGGVDLTTIRAIAETGIDCISVGDLTKSVKAIDLSLLIEDK